MITKCIFVISDRYWLYSACPNRQVLTILAAACSKLHLRDSELCDVAHCCKMPAPRICTVMLDELEQHNRTSQQHCLWQRIASALSDISSSGTSESASDLMSEVSDLASLMLIDTPDINVSSDISIHSDGPLPSSGSDTDSLFSISDFEVEYYMNWERHYRELFNEILTTQVLNPTLPIPKSSQLHLLDHWRIHNPERFRSTPADFMLSLRRLTVLSATSKTTPSSTIAPTTASYQYISS